MRLSIEAYRNKKGNKVNAAAEVGAGIGRNALDMMSGMEFKKLYLVENNYDGGAPRKFLDDLASSRPFVEVLYVSSVEGSTKVEDSSLDMIYIDATHSYEYVKMDIEHWYPKLKVGGWMIFHDWDIRNNNCGVNKAAIEFSNKNNLSLIKYENQHIGEASFERVR